jgi:dTDP-4-amino-4,6-dideoxygalactose transaminase
MQAAFLRVKLACLDDWNARRRTLASRYGEALVGQDLDLPDVPAWAEPVWHLYVVRSRQRDALRAHLEKHQIASAIHYPVPPHLQACFAGYSSCHLPLARTLASEVISLPMSPCMTAQEIGLVASAVRSFRGTRDSCRAR